MRHTEQRPDLAHCQVRPPVRRHQQHTISQVKAPLATRSAIGDLITTTVRHDPHQLPELTRFLPRERGNPLRSRCRDHLHHTMIDYVHDQTHTGLRDIP
jgi:hypothetical protein